jgi:hypothetical protein
MEANDSTEHVPGRASDTGERPGACFLNPSATVAPQTGENCGCGSQIVPGSAESGYVYALGQIEARFGSLAVEKEFAQAAGRDKTPGLTDRQTLHAVLSKPENGYLVRQLCWVMTIEGLETYLLSPRHSADFSLLVEAIRPKPSPLDLDVVIGIKGPLASPDTCNGLVVPIVAFDQIYSFDRDTLIKSIPRPEKAAVKDFAAVAEEVFDRIVQSADNAGATDENRALNYSVVRYPAIYARAADAFAVNSSLSAIEARHSPLSGVRKIVDIVFSFTNRSTDVMEKFFMRVDVTEEFPFLVTKLSPYYDR